jgi:hypothetical protein
MPQAFMGWMAASLACVLSGPVLSFAATEPPTMQSGGAQSPATGGRPDSQAPQLGPGNRGTGQRGAEGMSSLDPGKIRSEPSGPGPVVGQVLSIQNDVYIVRQPDGMEVILRTDNHTEVQSTINMGETVEAQVDNAGRVTELKPAGK